MKISDYTKKPLWTRVIYTRGLDARPQFTSDAYAADAQMRLDSSRKVALTQSDFVRELSPMAHDVFSTNIRSLRPKFKIAKDKETGEETYVFHKFEDVERIGLPIQESIRSNKTSYCFGNPVWLGNESGDKAAERMSRFKSHWNSSNMTAALAEVGRHLFGTADAAIYIYVEKGEIKYKVFGYEDNDCVTERFEVKDGERRRVGVRMFQIDGHTAVELYKHDVVELWVNANDDDIAKLFPNNLREKTEDGYTLINRVEHGFSEAPFVYFREKDVPWGIAQPICNKLDLLVSDLLESGRFFFNPFIFLKGGAISLPSTNFQGRAFASEDIQGDAKILSPPDASSMLDSAFTMLMRHLLDSTKTVFIHHEDLKGQNDSGAYLRMLCFPEMQWATNFYPRIDPQMKQLFTLFKEAVGRVEGKKVVEYRDLMFSYEMTPCIPQNLLEEALILNNSIVSGTLSRETCTEEHPLANPAELDRLAKDDKRKAEEAEREKGDKSGQVAQNMLPSPSIKTPKGEVKPPEAKAFQPPIKAPKAGEG